MSEEIKPLWKRVNWNNSIEVEEEEYGERTPLIRESTAIQVDNDSDKISPVPRHSNLEKNLDKVAEEAHKNIGKLLNRGDDLDDIRQKAETLEDSSKLFKKTTREQKDKVWWEHLNKSVWTYAFAILCALGGLLLLINIVESLIKMFSRPSVPPVTPRPPTTGPPPATPGPAPQPAPGNPGTAIPAFTCNCYCPPIYYPAPPQQSPRVNQQAEDPWGMYPGQVDIQDTGDKDDINSDNLNSATIVDQQTNQENVPNVEIPDT